MMIFVNISFNFRVTLYLSLFDINFWMDDKLFAIDIFMDAPLCIQTNFIVNPILQLRYTISKPLHLCPLTIKSKYYVLETWVVHY